MYLVTGARSGLGKFLQAELNAIGFLRGDSLDSLQSKLEYPFDAIIHCAFNINRDITSYNLKNYIDDNFLLLHQLLEIPHQKFIFISSADVYPKAETSWSEEDEFPIEKIETLYGLSKIMAEAIIKNKTEDYLILRPTAMLGIHARPNSLIKMLNGCETKFTLHANSNFNYILHHDVLQFIQKALTDNLCGIFNLASSTSVSLGEVALAFNKRDIQFGSFIYQVANLCNNKASKYCNVFTCSSFDNIKRFAQLRDNLC